MRLLRKARKDAGYESRVRIKISTKVSAVSLFIVAFQGAVSLLGMSVLVDRANRESFRTQLERSVRSMESFMDSTTDDLRIKADLLAGRQKVIDYADFGLRNLLQQELSLMQLPLKADALCMTDAQGEILASVGAARLTDSFRENSLVRGYWEGSALFAAPFSGQIHLWALRPVMRDTTLIGVLAIGLNLDSLFIHRAESTVGTSLILSWKDLAVASGTLPSDIVARFTEALQAGGDGMRGVEGIAGSRYFTADFPIVNPPGLHAWCFLDAGDSQRLLARYRSFSLGFLVLVLAAGFLASILLYRYAFQKPFRLFNEAIRRIADGHLDHPIEGIGRDEFGDLARAFEGMMISLRQRERELADLGRYNALVLANVTSGILTVAFDGTVTSINPAAAAFLGAGAAAAGGSLSDLNPHGELRRHLEESLQARSPIHFREIRTEVAGMPRTFSISVSPFLSPQGDRLGILAVLSDVTRERELERKLEISSRMAAMGEMVAGVAHQIRNPLGIMKVSAEMLRDQLADSGSPEPQRKLISMIVKETDSLGAVVSHFLDFARPLHMQKEPCRLEDLLGRVTDMLPLARFPGIELRCRFDEALPEVPLDASLFEQAFSNLLMNALQASAPGQTVLLETRREDGRPVVEIRDSGPGMDEGTRNRIFSPFFTTKDGGTGLGLAIAHRIVEGHGGRIEFQSEPGRGTAFRVRL